MGKQPIGVFDSGIGGTSILREIVKLLPSEDFIYLADSANAPYGQKSSETIIDLCKKNVEFLLEKDCKLIVVACNTATTNAISILRETYDVPFIGIEPAIKPAALQTQTKKVGVLATKGTLSSALFNSTSKLYASGIKVFEQEGTGLVKLIESGLAKSNEVRNLLEQFLRPMLKEGIDCLVLGCTHYPYLIPALKEILPNNVKIVDSGLAVAQQTKSVLKKNGLLNDDSTLAPKNIFYSNTNLAVLKELVNNSGVEVSYLDF